MFAAAGASLPESAIVDTDRNKVNPSERDRHDKKGIV